MYSEYTIWSSDLFLDPDFVQNERINNLFMSEVVEIDLKLKSSGEKVEFKNL
jgi:hypothetical protein